MPSGQKQSVTQGSVLMRICTAKVNMDLLSTAIRVYWWLIGDQCVCTSGDAVSFSETTRCTNSAAEICGKYLKELWTFWHKIRINWDINFCKNRSNNPKMGFVSHCSFIAAMNLMNNSKTPTKKQKQADLGPIFFNLLQALITFQRVYKGHRPVTNYWRNSGRSGWRGQANLGLGLINSLPSSFVPVQTNLHPQFHSKCNMRKQNNPRKLESCWMEPRRQKFETLFGDLIIHVSICNLPFSFLSASFASQAPVTGGCSLCGATHYGCSFNFRKQSGISQVASLMWNNKLQENCFSFCIVSW